MLFPQALIRPIHVILEYLVFRNVRKIGWYNNVLSFSVSFYEILDCVAIRDEAA